jgi:hypothetical protein
MCPYRITCVARATAASTGAWVNRVPLRGKGKERVVYYGGAFLQKRIPYAL